MSSKNEMHNMANGPPPPYSHRGYSPVPRAPPPSGYAQPPMASYAPAPPVFQTQQTSNNVVVVGAQPQAPAQVVHHVPAPRANTYVVLSAVLLVVCFLHGNFPAFVCLIPALIFSCAGEEHNNAGEYNEARSCGSYALGCNITAIIFYVLGFLAAVVVVAVYLTAGFSVATTHNCYYDNCYWSSYSDSCVCNY